MKSLVYGERIRENVLVKTKFGNCILCLTNFAVTLESITKGLILELDHESVISFQPIEKKLLKLVWSENSSIYDLIINYEEPIDIANKFKKIQTDYINSLRIAGIKTEERINNNKLNDIKQNQQN